MFNAFNDSTIFSWPLELRLLHSIYVKHLCARDLSLKKEMLQLG
jgi:hypothetical protein